MRLDISAKIKNVKNLLGLMVVATAISGPGLAQANEVGVGSYSARMVAQANLSDLQMKKSYALGIGRFDLDAHTEIIGWRLNQAWYFGRQDGLDSGLTLVWQNRSNQISLSKEGVRLTRRF